MTDALYSKDAKGPLLSDPKATKTAPIPLTINAGMVTTLKRELEIQMIATIPMPPARTNNPCCESVLIITKIANSKYAAHPNRKELFIPCEEINPKANIPENPINDD